MEEKERALVEVEKEEIEAELSNPHKIKEGVYLHEQWGTFYLVVYAQGGFEAVRIPFSWEEFKALKDVTESLISATLRLRALAKVQERG